jgi:hypothetical protein
MGAPSYFGGVLIARKDVQQIGQKECYWEGNFPIDYQQDDDDDDANNGEAI